METPNNSIDIHNLREQIKPARWLDEAETISSILENWPLSDAQRSAVKEYAAHLVEHIRSQKKASLVERFMDEYRLNTDEGIALMCLAEAYLRTPDSVTLDALIRDKIGGRKWRHEHPADDSFIMSLSTWTLMLSGKIFKHRRDNEHYLNDQISNVVQRLGEPVARRAIQEIMRLLGEQFVLGRSIKEALENSRENINSGYLYSYDMLGESARSMEDAKRYFDDYSNSIHYIGQHCDNNNVIKNNGISIKLSALHPRYSYSQSQRVMDELLPRVIELCEQCAGHNMMLNIDAEEMMRIESYMHITEAVCKAPSLKNWQGFGVVIQAYSKQAPYIIDWLAALAKTHKKRISVRLVKGAYWDTEIKHAQVNGVENYPVFTNKHHSDCSYIYCARKLLDYNDDLFPQFATHNAHSISAILELCNANHEIEFQRLHGMGDVLHDVVMRENNYPCRIYAPVGIHEDLLAYLVRRLLENGANNSFVNQIQNTQVPVSDIVSDPYDTAMHDSTHYNQNIALPPDILQPQRPNSKGFDIEEILHHEQLNQAIEPFINKKWQVSSTGSAQNNEQNQKPVYSPAILDDHVGDVIYADESSINEAINNARNARQSWQQTSTAQRAEILLKAARLYEDNIGEITAILMREAGKTILDAIAEIREAVDFIYYYAQQAQTINQPPRGVFVCISPWNFPLAIFTGQVVAALSTGNCVIAKPAEQTALIAGFAVDLLHRAGIDKNVLSLQVGDGKIGAQLTQNEHIDGVCFTGSTETAMLIDQSLAKHNPDAVLIAETGGINSMIVDSSALLETAVDDIIESAFRSAGQRCSALRLLLVQEEIADNLITLLKGACEELNINNPWFFDTDIGPIIDSQAHEQINNYIEHAKSQHEFIYSGKINSDAENHYFLAPHIFKLNSIEDLQKEIFGPVLHIVTYKAKEMTKAIDAVNQKGFGLTFAIHSRIDERIRIACEHIDVGNIYINRNQVGAVVGVQPFGGHGLSGTGPKAGGALYLKRFIKSVKQTPQDASAMSSALFTSLLNAAKSLGEDDQREVENTIRHALSVNAKAQELKGPTGECNQYQLLPRGVILCAGAQQNTFTTLLAQTILALCAGNQVLLSAKDHANDAQKVKAFIHDTMLPAQRIEILDESVLSLCTQADMVYAEDNLSQIRDKLANRDGPRINIFSMNDAAEFCYIEQTTSEDTTASGGNTQLLLET